MKFTTTLLILFATVALPSFTQSTSAAYQSMERKLDAIVSNGASSNVRPISTEITAGEANAWVSEGGVRLPPGVSDVRFSSQPAVITADCRIDFDKVTAGAKSSNPFLALFTGVHDVNVVAQASAAQGVGHVRVESMSIDGVTVPRAAMEFFVNRYLKPKYPNVGLDTKFRMPSRIDVAVVGKNKATVTQR